VKSFLLGRSPPSVEYDDVDASSLLPLLARVIVDVVVIFALVSPLFGGKTRPLLLQFQFPFFFSSKKRDDNAS
tara:strand:- start:29 stop:247 length:219 start_codon:yes stop_codon:yes gene_type:complete